MTQLSGEHNIYSLPLKTRNQSKPSLSIKGVLHLVPQKAPKISMFCALPQNYQHLFEKIIYASNSKFSNELKNSIKIKVGQVVFELLIQNEHFGCLDL